MSDAPTSGLNVVSDAPIKKCACNEPDKPGSHGRTMCWHPGVTHAAPAIPETLRDRFAMAALSGLLASPALQSNYEPAIAADAYRIADAMLKARETQDA